MSRIVINGDVTLKRNNATDAQGVAIPPTVESMNYGEIAINYNAKDACIFIKALDSNGQQKIVKFVGEEVIAKTLGDILGESAADLATLKEMIKLFEGSSSDVLTLVKNLQTEVALKANKTYVDTELGKKLGKTEKAADSALFDGLGSSRYMRASSIGGNMDANNRSDMTICKTSINNTYTNFPDNPNNRTSILTIHGFDPNYKNQLFFGNGDVYNRIDNGSWNKLWSTRNFDPGTKVHIAQVANETLNNLAVNCHYQLNSGCTSLPTGAQSLGSQLIHMNWDNNTAKQLFFDIGTGMYYRTKTNGSWNNWNQVIDTGNTYIRRSLKSKSQDVDKWYLIGTTVDNHYNGFTAIVTGNGIASGGVACTYHISVHSNGSYAVRALGHQGGSNLKFGVIIKGRIIQIWVRSNHTEFNNITVEEEHIYGGAVVYTELNGTNPINVAGAAVTAIEVKQIWDASNSNLPSVDWNCGSLNATDNLNAKRSVLANNINGINNAITLKNTTTSSAPGSEYTIGSDIRFTGYQDVTNASIKARHNAYFGTSHLYLECPGGITLQNNTSIAAYRLVIGASGHGTEAAPRNYDLAFRGNYGGDYARIRSIEQSGTSGHGTMQFFVRGNKGTANSEPDLVMTLDRSKNATFENNAIVKNNLRVLGETYTYSADGIETFEAGGGATRLADLTDVDLTGAQGNFVLYQSTETNANGDRIWKARSDAKSWSDISGKPTTFTPVEHNHIGSTYVTTPSDRALKTDLKRIDLATNTILSLTPYTYNWTTQAIETFGFKNHHAAGVIAQEIESILPFAVQPLNDEFKAVDYIQIIPYLIAAFQELHSALQDKNIAIANATKEYKRMYGANEKLAKRVSDLESELINLKNQIAA